MIAINITLFSTPFSALDPRRQERERPDQIEQAHKTDAPPTAPAKAVLDAAISIVKQYALRRNDVAWDKVEPQMRTLAADYEDVGRTLVCPAYGQTKVRPTSS